MTESTSVPAIQFTPAGLVLPAQADILNGVQADINAAFGGKLNPSLNTPQGQLATSQTAIIADKNNQIAIIANQFNPDFADGRWQDALARIYFISRNPAEPTAVQCLCIGLAGTPIPVGARAKAQDGNIYICTEAGEIPAGGSITLPFACTVTGPIACPANSLNQIYQAIPGWDSINNVSDGVPGSNVESRADFEARRQASVALNAVNSVQSIKAAVLNVPNVLDAYVIDNPLGTSAIIGGYTMLPHSIYVAVVGGDAAAIAEAIWNKKSDGADYNGNTTQTVYDTTYDDPKPQYTVKFETPAALPIYFAVTLAAAASPPANYATLVQNAISTAFVGADGGAKARIGSTLYASRFYAAVMAASPSLVILSLFIGTSASPTSSFVTVDIDQIPTINVANIAVGTA